MRELGAAAERYREGLERWEAAGERLRRDRIAAMEKAARAGIPVSEIADQFSLSHQRVSAMLRESG
jgi:hypothetical protein